MSGYVVGAGCSRGCPPEELAGLVDEVLDRAGVRPGEVRVLATIDTRSDEPAVVELVRQTGWTLRTHEAAALATVEVPTPSPVVRRHVGTGSVAEAAALLSAGVERLTVEKHRSEHATCALAKARK